MFLRKILLHFLGLNCFNLHKNILDTLALLEIGCSERKSRQNTVNFTGLSALVVRKIHLIHVTFAKA